jgi:hypothetical protein
MYENYAVAFGYYFSTSKPQQWRTDVRKMGFERLKQLGYVNLGQDSRILFEYDFLTKLAWALHRTTDGMVEPMIRWSSDLKEKKFPTRGANAP